MKKTLLLVAFLLALLVAGLSTPTRRTHRGDIPHPAPCCPGEKEDRAGNCYEL